MAIETRVAQKDKLYALLAVKRACINENVRVVQELEKQIEQAKTVMEPEDVAYVEKQMGV